MTTNIVMTQSVGEKYRIIKALKENDFYCPCKLEKTEDTKCICKEFREQEEGFCHCGLYQKIKSED